MSPMHPLARRCLRTSLVFLVLGVATGLHMSSAMHLGAGVMHSYYVPAHTHVLLVGFLLLALAGAALWRLPEREPRREGWNELAYWCTTLGTACRYLGEVGLGYRSARWISIAVFAASCVQASGLLVFCWLFWRRLR